MTRKQTITLVALIIAIPVLSAITYTLTENKFDQSSEWNSALMIFYFLLWGLFVILIANLEKNAKALIKNIKENDLMNNKFLRTVMFFVPLLLTIVAIWFISKYLSSLLDIEEINLLLFFIVLLGIVAYLFIIAVFVGTNTVTHNENVMEFVKIAVDDATTTQAWGKWRLYQLRLASWILVPFVGPTLIVVFLNTSFNWMGLFLAWISLFIGWCFNQYFITSDHLVNLIDDPSVPAKMCKHH
ncbi:hypothetical protein ACFL0F_00470 [Patescibacteria group bacterium]